MNNYKDIPIWVCWRFEPGKDGKLTKVPYDPKNGWKAKSNNPRTWATFEQATAAMERNGYDGVGFCFSKIDGNIALTGIDLDAKDDKPRLSPEEMQELIAHTNTYTELSPSGNGYHILFLIDLSKLPADYKTKYYQKNPNNGCEAYIAGMTSRFFTYTGEAVNSEDVEERTQQFLEFLEKHMQKKSKNKPSTSQPASNGMDGKGNKIIIGNDNDILSIARRAKNGNKFTALFDRGDVSQYKGDHSSADIALANILSFYCQGDTARIEELFNQSALGQRDKWKNRADYRTATIAKGVDLCGGTFYRPPGRPKKQRLASGGGDNWNGDIEFITINGLQSYLEKHSISVMYNLITNSLDITGLEESITREHAQNSLPIVVYDQMQYLYKKVSKGDIRDFLSVVALRNKYNPVLDTINSVAWDGVDRLPEVFNILKIANSDNLSKILIKKWLWQCLSLAKNTHTETHAPYGADGVLVLVGEQGIGKTSFLRRIALKSEFFLEGAKVNPDNKDSVIAATSVWITELGEIGSTFRSDLDHLKSFITQRVDTYRKPYGHATLKLARKTSFCGSCNDVEYLIDRTGNRRFWTVLTNGINLAALENLDVSQLWAQVEAKTKNNIQGFRLTAEEQTALAKRNAGHEKPIKGLDEILDLIAKADDNTLEYREVTISDFKAAHEILRNYTVRQIGEALDKAGISAPEQPYRVDGIKGRYRRLPMHKKAFTNSFGARDDDIPPEFLQSS